MKLNTKLNTFILIFITFCSFEAVAYDAEKEKEKCRPPKIQELTLPEYSELDKKEVPPETEFSFVLSGWANPNKIKLNAKNMDIPFTVESTETYHKVKAKLLPEFTGQAIRLNARITAVLGCYTTQGWLIKVADKPKVPEPTTPVVEPVPAATNVAPNSSVPPVPQTVPPVPEPSATNQPKQ